MTILFHDVCPKHEQAARLVSKLSAREAGIGLKLQAELGKPVMEVDESKVLHLSAKSDALLSEIRNLLSGMKKCCHQ